MMTTATRSTRPNTRNSPAWSKNVGKSDVRAPWQLPRSAWARLERAGANAGVVDLALWRLTLTPGRTPSRPCKPSGPQLSTFFLAPYTSAPRAAPGPAPLLGQSPVEHELPGQQTARNFARRSRG